MKLTPRTLFALPAIGAFTSVWAPVVIGTRLAAGHRAADRAAGVWIRFVRDVTGMEVEAIGVERVPPGSYVVVSNHQSHLDSIALLLTAPSPLRMLAKKSLFRIPFFGAVMSAMGHVPIDRRKGKTDFDSLRLYCERLRKNGQSIMVFPEGTRSPDRRVRDFKSGAFRIAKELGLPIVPVSITGTGLILPAKSLSVTPGRARIEWHAPIDVAELDAEEAQRRVHALIKARVEGVGH